MLLCQTRLVLPPLYHSGAAIKESVTGSQRKIPDNCTCKGEHGIQKGWIVKSTCYQYSVPQCGLKGLMRTTKLHSSVNHSFSSLSHRAKGIESGSEA